MFYPLTWRRAQKEHKIEYNYWPLSSSLLATVLAKSRLFRARTLYSTMVQRLKELKTALIRRDMASDITICRESGSFKHTFNKENRSSFRSLPDSRSRSHTTFVRSFWSQLDWLYLRNITIHHIIIEICSILRAIHALITSIGTGVNTFNSYLFGQNNSITF